MFEPSTSISTSSIAGAVSKEYVIERPHRDSLTSLHTTPFFFPEFFFHEEWPQSSDSDAGCPSELHNSFK